MRVMLKIVAGLTLAMGALMLGLHGLDGDHAQSADTLVALEPGTVHARRVALQQAGAPLSAADTEDLYQEKCSLCHGADRAGKPPNFPTLIGATGKYSDAEITNQIRKGKGRMPAFPGLTDEEVKALIAYLKTPAPTAPAPTLAAAALFVAGR